MSKNPYEILGVSESANEDELKKAYKAKCFEYHPDRFATSSKEEQEEAERKFKEVQTEYNSIQDGSYAASKEQHPFSGFGGFNIHDLFRNIHSVFKKPEKPKFVMADLEPVRLSFKEAVMGCKKDIKTEMQIRCFDCFGHGNVETSQTCEVCAGSGVKTSKQKSGFFASMLQTQCGECGGSGKKIDSCQSCGGAGSIRYTFEDVLETTPNNPLGRKYNRTVQDVSIEFSVRVIVDIPPGFRTENNPPQLVTTVTLPLIDFLLGGSKSILIDDECGNVDFQFSSLQKEVVVDAKGLPKNGRRDSLKIILEPELPKKITEEQKELLNKLKQTGL